MSDSRPVIGVTCYVEDVDRHPWTAQRSVVLPHRYVDQLERAGALAVVLPPRPDADDDLALTVLERLDGLVIAGGADVEAARYGARAAPDLADSAPGPGRVGAGPGTGLRGAGPPGARGVPRHAGDGRRGGRGARPAPARRRRPRRPLATAGGVHLAPRDPGARHPARRPAGQRAPRRADLPPPGRAARRRSRAPPTACRPGTPTAPWRAMEDPSSAFRLAVQWHPEAGRRRAAVRGARGGRRHPPVVRCAARLSPVTARPGDNRPVTKLNRLAIAAGAASALGALAAAGKGVNTAMGGRPTGARLERAQRSPAYRAGAFHNTSRGTSSMPSGQRDVLRRFRENAATRHPALPIPVVTATHEPRTEGVHVTWFGHASCLVELDGVRLLMDPVWSERCSPSQHVGPAPAARGAGAAQRPGPDRRRRHLARPLRPPRHGHRPPARRPHRGGLPRAARRRRAPRRLGRAGRARRRVRLGGGPATCGGVRVTAVEAQHFSGRGLRRDGTLWASWVLAGRAGKVFFSGDTGFFDGYARLGAEHGPFDVSLMAVGAYDPAWHDIHLEPGGGRRGDPAAARRPAGADPLVHVRAGPAPLGRAGRAPARGRRGRGGAGGGSARRRPGRRGRPARRRTAGGSCSGRTTCPPAPERRLSGARRVAAPGFARWVAAAHHSGGAASVRPRTGEKVPPI